ncbi:hypothetical protein ABT301_19565 [Streptomyces sp. NPDC000987]|uniref:hypothetical protein n=1 Tax=Streptomyces sp. NPDC000987 TaxID=3154374 RepID=UPI0033347A53
MGRELRTLLDLYEESGQALAPAPPVLRERVSGSRSTGGIVLDERVVGLRTQAAEVLAQWARLVVEERGGAGCRPAGTEVDALVKFLGQQLPWLAEHPAGVHFDDELTELRTAFSGLFGPGRTRRLPLGQCTQPGCAEVLYGVLPAPGDRMPSHVSCGAGHVLPPRQWLLVASRMREAA